MKSNQNLIVLLMILGIIKTSLGQNAHEVNQANNNMVANDTSDVNDLLKNAATTMNNNPQQAYKLAEQALVLSEKLKWKKGAATALSRMGNAKEITSEFNAAIVLQEKALVIRMQLKDSLGIANSYRNLGCLFTDIGEIKKAENYHQQSLAIFKMLNYSKGIAASYSNLGFTFEARGNFSKAKKYYNESLQVSKSINNQKGMAMQMASVGNVEQLEGEYEKAIVLYLDALKIFDQIGEKQLLANSYGNLSIIYLRIKDYEKANAFNQKSSDINELLGNTSSYSLNILQKANILGDQNYYQQAIDVYKKGIELNYAIDDSLSNANFYLSIVDCYLQLNNIAEASINLKKANDIFMITEDREGLASNLFLEAKILLMENKPQQALLKATLAHKESIALKSTHLQASITKFLADCSEKLNANKEALSYIRQHLVLKDSLLVDKKFRQIAYAEAEYKQHQKIEKANQKSKTATHLLQKKDAFLSKEKNKNKNMTVTIFLSFMILVGVGTLYAKTHSEKKVLAEEIKIESESKNKLDLENQRITFKSKEVEDSIQAALRLQKAILPEDKIVKQYLEQSFILYLPKDIVAGDFYWMHTDGEWVWFAACDCTGHGVPGAMLTLICHEAMNKAVKEMKAQNPAQALDYASQLVETQLNITDGMDASLCLFNTKTNELFWAGANNPLWVFRKNNLLEYKADKQPVGKYEYRKNFTLHKINLEINDAIYIFSDGFADQFGGLMGKKMMKKRFEATLKHLQNLPMELQKQALITHFQNWKQEAEQVDDVLVMGYRL